MSAQHSRRKFIRQLSQSALLFGMSPLEQKAAAQHFEERLLIPEKKYSANDKIRIAVIGTGIMGHNDLTTALRIPGVELAAACDLYSGRLTRMKELYGQQLFTTRDYREVMQRKDIDAVIIATSDHYHARISREALASGKHVYCEKPMVHRFQEGPGVIDSWKQSGKTMQVGSQGISGLLFSKARELYRSGEIGVLNCIEASTDRQSANGAWQYTLPTDGDPTTVDWDSYIAGMPKQPWDANKFFRWRNYRDFGTGVSGDLFVHLITGIHFITGSSGPTRVLSGGQLCYWKDGRDVPDVMTCIMEYPETATHPAFQLMLRVNFVSGSGEKSFTRFVGSEGALEMRDGELLLTHSLMTKAPGIGGWDSLETYPKEMQDKLLAQYHQRYAASDEQRPQKPDIRYKQPDTFNTHEAHFADFFEGVRTGRSVIEDPVFGFRAAAPCLAANESYFQKKIIDWDPVNMKLR
jgi:predicted dehydrogenase